MLIKETFIDELLAEELKGLCHECSHFSSCSYRKQTNKVIIHCEWFDKKILHQKGIRTINDLCMHCKKSSHCQLPKANSGVWKCGEYS